MRRCKSPGAGINEWLPGTERRREKWYETNLCQPEVRTKVAQNIPTLLQIGKQLEGHELKETHVEMTDTAEF